MAKSDPIYRVIFSQEDKIYEVYARYISEDTLVGFIEIEEMVFSGAGSVVVDPSEEKLRTEFNGVKRSYIPMHMVLRIDEMVKEGPAKIKDQSTSNNVHDFPGVYRKPLKEKE